MNYDTYKKQAEASVKDRSYAWKTAIGLQTVDGLKPSKNSKYSDKKLVKHLARFVSLLWQNHVFAEGNTRTTAVFFIKYLRRLGFDVTNDTFEENAWYFRIALVRAYYNNREKGIIQTTEYIERFLENLLLGKKNNCKIGLCM